MAEISIKEAPLEALFAYTGSSENGLSEEQISTKSASRRHLLKKESSFYSGFKLLVRQFSSPLVLLLVIAVLLSAVLGEVSDTLIIFFILLATGLLSFWQELHAGKAVERLTKMIELKSRTLRAGAELLVPTDEILPGDVILLSAGDIIPADCRIIESNELHVNESTLTGESYPAEKMPGVVMDNAPLIKSTNCLWQGTNVVSGTARVIAVHTGSDTLFGEIATSLTETPETAFEKGIKQFGYFLLRITAVLTLVILVINIYFEKPLLDSVLFSLALAVGMAPELLPAIMTVAMSSGAGRMMKKKVIVKKLSSIFNLGEVNILCTDKTGTITEGSIQVKDLVNSEGVPDERVRKYAVLNARFQQGFNNPIDEAVTGLDVDISGYEKVDEIPYDFIRKRLSVLVRLEDESTIVTKGALTSVLDVCSFVSSHASEPQALDAARRAEISRRFEDFSAEGYRVLGIAYKPIKVTRMKREDEADMVFAGFLLLEDPLKESALSSIQRLQAMHVGIKVITGDNQFAARNVGRKLGMENARIITGEELNEMSPEALSVQAPLTDIFAEIEPHQKVRVVKALQQARRVVAYIGDGINDVAAINAADAGISASNAVDAAKQAADFVLMEKDLSVIADGIQEGRRSFVNSMKYIFITTGATFGNMFSVATASLLLPFLPMLPKQILLTNFITDLPALAIASDNVDEQQLGAPQKWNMKLIRNFMIVFGLHSSLFDFLTFYVLYFKFRLVDAPFRTGWFLESVITELLILLVVRTKKPFLKSRPGQLLAGLTAVSFVFTFWLPWSPFAETLGLGALSKTHLLAVCGILLSYVVTADWLKILFFRFNARVAGRE